MKNIILNKLNQLSLFQIKTQDSFILVNPLNEAAYSELLGFEKLLNEIYLNLIIKHSNVSQQLKKEIEQLLIECSTLEKNKLLLNKSVFSNQTFFIKSFLYEKKILKRLKVKKLPKKVKLSIESLYSIMNNILINSNV